MKSKGLDIKTYLSFLSGYKEVMYRIAFGYLGDATKAMDAVDKAVYLGYVHRKELKETKYLKTWLTRILINECYRILRKEKKEVISDIQEKSARDAGPDSITGFSADDTVTLKLAVQRLPEDLRKVVVLRYFAGYTILDTANILGIPEGTVSTRARKALEILRIEMTEQFG